MSSKPSGSGKESTPPNATPDQKLQSLEEKLKILNEIVHDGHQCKPAIKGGIGIMQSNGKMYTDIENVKGIPPAARAEINNILDVHKKTTLEHVGAIFKTMWYKLDKRLQVAIKAALVGFTIICIGAVIAVPVLSVPFAILALSLELVVSLPIVAGLLGVASGGGVVYTHYYLDSEPAPKQVHPK